MLDGIGVAIKSEVVDRSAKRFAIPVERSASACIRNPLRRHRIRSLILLMFHGYIFLVRIY
jgi:hypothetical protein